jgi:DNA-binding NtrC family response regulator
MDVKKPRILLVDDEDSILEVFRRFLGRDFDLRTASSAMEALAIVQTEEPFAVVLSDYGMRGMNGVEFLLQMRGLSPHTSRILLSGQFDTPGTPDDLAVVLLKPCPLTKIMTVVREAIAANHLRIQGETHES